LLSLALLVVSPFGCAATGSAAGGSGTCDKLRCYELRTYTTAEGRLDALHKRFRDHTCGLFEKHGMTLIGFWTPTEGEQAKNTLIYLLAFPSREHRDASFKAFRDDPVWKKAKEESRVDGPIVTKVESVFLTPTDYSYLK